MGFAVPHAQHLSPLAWEHIVLTGQYRWTSNVARRPGQRRELRPAAEAIPPLASTQPVSQAGIESVRGTTSDSAISTLLQRQLIALDDHRLFTDGPALPSGLASTLTSCVVDLQDC